MRRDKSLANSEMDHDLTLPVRMRLYDFAERSKGSITFSGSFFILSPVLVLCGFERGEAAHNLLPAGLLGLSVASIMLFLPLAHERRKRRKAFRSRAEFEETVSKFDDFDLTKVHLLRLLRLSDTKDDFDFRNTVPYYYKGFLRNVAIRLEDGVFNLYDASNGKIISTVKLDDVTILEDSNEEAEDFENSSPQLWQVLSS